MNFYKLQCSQIIRETNDAVSICFSIPDDLKDVFNYQAGQYLTLKVDIDGQEERRAYSISSVPKVDKDIKITIKSLEGGKVSVYFPHNIKQGDYAEVMPPMGNFTFIPDFTRSQNYSLFAAGSGITPLFSILKSILLFEPMSKVDLFYSNRYENEIIFAAELKELEEKYPKRLKVHHFLTKYDENWQYYRGRINYKQIGNILKNQENPKKKQDFYLCGPREYMSNIQNALAILEFPKNRIHRESFTADLDSLNNDNRPELIDRNVQVRVYGKTHNLQVAKGDTIVAAGIKQNLILPYSCQIGACTTCRAKLISGKVYMDMHDGLSESDIKNNYILTCRAFPESDDVIIDLDY